ncbi:MAG: hypothetical protein ACR2JG_14970 [Geodermatophilaceae bacterium]
MAALVQQLTARTRPAELCKQAHTNPPIELALIGVIGRFLTLSTRTVQSGFKITPVCGA